MNKTSIYTYSIEDTGLELLTEVTLDTVFAVGPKYNLTDEGWLCFGFNVYAIGRDDKAVLLETYGEHEEACAVRDDVVDKVMCEYLMVVI